MSTVRHSRAAALIVLAFLVFLAGCPRKDKDDSARAAGVGVALSVTSSSLSRPGASGHRPGANHPAQPPIDCPLRKQGIDPAHLRPFEDVEKYIAFLERADRAAWQKPDEVVAALDLKGTETVVDVGAGSGYFAFRFAKALSQGKVIAADTEAEMVRHIHHQTMMGRAQNVEAKLIQPADPAIPASADLVFICDVLHHVPDRAVWMAKVASEMRSGARLVVIEFKEGNLPEGPPEGAKIPRVQLLELITKAGLVLDSERTFLPYQVFVVFRRP